MLQNHLFDVGGLTSYFLLFGIIAVAGLCVLHGYDKMTCSKGHVFQRRKAYVTTHVSGYADNIWCPTCFDDNGVKTLVETDLDSP